MKIALKCERPRRIVLWAALLVASFCPAGSAFGQYPNFPQIQQFGIDGFRLMLQQKGLDAVPNQVGTALNGLPHQTVAIVMGDLKTVIRIQQQLDNFVLNGGALLIASDLRGMKISPAPICGTWVTKAPPLTSKERTVHGYQNYFDCPIVTRFDNEAEPVLFDGVDSIVSNRPGAIVCENVVKQVAWLPNRGNQPLMATFRHNKKNGRMLFVADHSIFINEMLVHGDNARFVSNVTTWLCEGGKRETLVLINDGQVLANWSFGASPPAIPLSSLLRAAQYGGLANLQMLPTGDSVLPFINESVGRSQRENEFNTVARRTGYVLARGRGVRFAIFFMSTVLAVAFFCWLMTTRSTPRRWLSLQDWNQPQAAIRPAKR